LKKIKLLSLSCILLFCCSVQAQNVAIGDWQTHLPFHNVSSLTTDGEQLIAGTFGGVLYFDPSDNSVERLSTVNGLSGIDVAKVYYDNDLNLLIIGYNDFGIDIYNGKSVTTFSDIKNSNIQGLKRLNKILKYDNLIYLCGTFGVLVVDILNKVVLENYSLSDGSSVVEAYDIAFTDEHIFVATGKGIFQAGKTNANLFNVSEWILHNEDQNISQGAVTNLTVNNNVLFAVKAKDILEFNSETWQMYYTIDTLSEIKSFTFNNDILYASTLIAGTGEVITVKNEELLEKFTANTMQRPNDIVFINQSVYVGDNWNGINKIENNTVSNFRPNGPSKQNNYALTVDNNNVLWVAGGSAPGNFGSSISYSDAGIYIYDNLTWKNQNKYSLGQDQFVDVVSVAVNPLNGNAYLGTYIYGVFEIEAGGTIEQLTNDNSGLERSLGNEIGVIDMAYDLRNNLWMTNLKTENPIKVLKADGQWQSFKPNFNPPNLTVTEILVSQLYNHVWIVHDRQGIMVYNYGNDINSTADDQYVFLNDKEESGNLPDSRVYALAEDEKGFVWVGTSAGIGIYYCPFDMFTENGCDATIPIVDIDGNPDLLLVSDFINCITVDNANRKWIGTNNGVWLLSDEGNEAILNFTTQNSPLPSDRIIDIAVNESSGDVFFGTGNGIMSYRGDATKGQDNFNDVLVFPNPVEPGYLGPVNIKNLVDGTRVKITDISGNLVFDTESLGGQVVWNQKDYTDRMVRSGVYLIFATNNDGSLAYEGKIMLIR